MRPEATRGFPPGFARGRVNRDALLALSRVPGIVPRDLHALAWREGSASACLRAVRGKALGEANAREADAARLEDLREALVACEARMLVPGEPGYPKALEDLPDPPAWLFVRGRLPDARTVAVVGARKCSPYGREVAETLGGGLASAGVCVVSGAAIGVDAAGHRGALGAGGPTVAILGSGIDVLHPPSNRRLIGEVAACGAVLSEYPPGTPPEPRRFPARNRIVAALSEAAVVVEGAFGSGSLITAELALELGRPVLAVPGPITSPLSEAPLGLISDGAGLVQGADDVLEALGLLGGEGATRSVPNLPETEQRALESVAGTPMTAESVALTSGLPPGEVLAALASLELRGLVRSVGGRYERTAGAGRGG